MSSRRDDDATIAHVYESLLAGKERQIRELERRLAEYQDARTSDVDRGDDRSLREAGR